MCNSPCAHEKEKKKKTALLGSISEPRSFFRGSTDLGGGRPGVHPVLVCAYSKRKNGLAAVKERNQVPIDYYCLHSDNNIDQKIKNKDTYAHTFCFAPSDL